MDNPYTGDVDLTIGESTFTLRVDYAAWAAMIAAFGKDKLGEVINATDPNSFAQMLSICLHRHHPEMTAEAVFELSPPVVPAAQAVVKAMTFHQFGPGKDKEPDPMKARPNRATRRANTAKARKTK